MVRWHGKCVVVNNKWWGRTQARADAYLWFPSIAQGNGDLSIDFGELWMRCHMSISKVCSCHWLFMLLSYPKAPVQISDPAVLDHCGSTELMLFLKLFQPKENGCFMEQSFSRKSHLIHIMTHESELPVFLATLILCCNPCCCCQ